jgi:hypothetical protein
MVHGQSGGKPLRENISAALRGKRDRKENEQTKLSKGASMVPGEFKHVQQT